MKVSFTDIGNTWRRTDTEKKKVGLLKTISSVIASEQSKHIEGLGDASIYSSEV